MIIKKPTKITKQVVVSSLAASGRWPSNTNNLALCFFLRNSFYTYVSIGGGSGWCMAASNLRQTILKKSKIYKITVFLKMARGGKWPRVAADGCNQLQLVAATCPSSHLHPLADTCPEGLQQVPAKWLPSGCLSKWLPSGCKWLFFRKSK